jgi:5-methylcytosine-specific restriction endonuclease McrA
MKKNYSDLLKDPRWQIKRESILKRDNYTCQECGSNEKLLHVHHKYYDANTPPWEYPANSLITLCRTCHEVWDSDRNVARDYYKSLLCAGWNSNEITEVTDLLCYYSPDHAIKILQNG